MGSTARDPGRSASYNAEHGHGRVGSNRWVTLSPDLSKLNHAATIHATVLASPVVRSDETPARVSGKNWWEWVFVGTLAVLHVIRPSRGEAVVRAVFGEIRPMVWVSDMLGSQRGHAVEWQMCLAHLPRDAT
jgi:hypothetical protein